MFERFMKGEIAYIFSTKKHLSDFLFECQRHAITNRYWPSHMSFRGWCIETMDQQKTIRPIAYNPSEWSLFFVDMDEIETVPYGEKDGKER